MTALGVGVSDRDAVTGWESCKVSYRPVPDYVLSCERAERDAAALYDELVERLLVCEPYTPQYTLIHGKIECARTILAQAERNTRAARAHWHSQE